eukprot:1850074-Pyramimonas_sp.AAC.1
MDYPSPSRPLAARLPQSTGCAGVPVQGVCRCILILTRPTFTKNWDAKVPGGSAEAPAPETRGASFLGLRRKHACQNSSGAAPGGAAFRFSVARIVRHKIAE